MKKKEGYRRGEVSEFDAQSHLSVAAHVCVNIRCPHSGLVVSYKKKMCETLPCRQFAGGFRWLKSSVELDGSDGHFPGS